MWIYNIYAFRVGPNQIRTVQSGIGMRWKIEIEVCVCVCVHVLSICMHVCVNFTDILCPALKANI